jgi:tripartite-type tricarboxylate transporter receptor subunit TctC
MAATMPSAGGHFRNFRQRQLRPPHLRAAPALVTAIPEATVMMIVRPHVLRLAGALIALATLLAGHHAVAQTNYPDRPIRLIVGFTPGSATDITARIFADKLNQLWNVPVIVENLPGGGGGVAAARVAKSTSDGYTLMWGANGALTINPSLQSKLLYDPPRDFAPISLVLRMASVIAVNNAVPANSMQDLIALARAQPGKLSYAHPGIGTPQHIAGELLKQIANVDMIQVPYRGAVFTDVLDGRVPIVISNMGSVLPTVQDGRLRGIAVTSLERSPSLPALPTVAESGFPGFEATSWFALVAPAGTPQAIVDKVHQVTLTIVSDPDMRAKFAQLGVDTVGNSPGELAAIITSDIAKWAKVIADAGIKVGE